MAILNLNANPPLEQIGNGDVMFTWRFYSGWYEWEENGLGLSRQMEWDGVGSKVKL